MIFSEEDYLMLSGIQHFKFCRRQWALIHIEQQWAENFRTIDGAFMHEKAHQTGEHEMRKDVLIARGMHIRSPKLGVSGQCDVLEFHRDNEHGISLNGREGLWLPFPVEYKRGKPNPRSGDNLQLCGQAMCLEEMFCCEIPKGALFYGSTHRRKEIVFDQSLRNEVVTTLEEMHKLFQRKYTPKAKPSRSCSACSLKDLCMPELSGIQSVGSYIREIMEKEK